MSSHYYGKPRRLIGPRRLITDFIRGVQVEFYTYGDVFSAREIDKGTKLLLEAAIVPDKGLILDMGCGYGVIGITLVKAHPGIKAILVDSNPRAVELARLNARINNVKDRVVIYHGNLYNPIKDMVFDVIISNPPLAAGWKTIEELIAKAPSHLKPGGSIQLVFKKGEDKARRILEKYFNRVKQLTRKHGYTVLYAEKNNNKR